MTGAVVISTRPQLVPKPVLTTHTQPDVSSWLLNLPRGASQERRTGKVADQRPPEKGGHGPEPRTAAPNRHRRESRTLVSRTSYLE